MKLYEHEPRLYTRGDLSKETIFDLYKNLKYEVIDLTPRGNPFAKDLLSARYHHHPLSDGQITERNLEAAHQAALEAINLHDLGAEVIIHCHAGRNRACFVMGLVISELHPGWSGDKIVEHIRSVRPNALANEHFEAFLRSLP